MIDPLAQLYMLRASQTPGQAPPLWPGSTFRKEPLMLKVGSFAKAIVSAFAAGTAALVTAMGDDVIVTGEWVTIGLAVLGALGVVYMVPNAERSEQRRPY